MQDLTGQRFGRLVALEPTDKRECRAIIWRCVCDCGNEKLVRSTQLRNGEYNSCGCLQREAVAQVGKNSATHGESKTNLYARWCKMRGRCDRKTDRNYEKYGGRGIKVCERWQSWETFRDDVVEMGCKPGYDMHRVNNDGDYSPDNVVFIEHSQHVSLHRNSVETS